MNFTPGPWRVDDHGFLKENGKIMDKVGKSVCPHCRQPGNDQPVTMQILAKGWGVCQLGSFVPKKEYEQHLANARLIAASPALFELVQKALDLNVFVDGSDERERAETLIGLVKGE